MSLIISCPCPTVDLFTGQNGEQGAAVLLTFEISGWGQGRAGQGEATPGGAQEDPGLAASQAWQCLPIW